MKYNGLDVFDIVLDESNFGIKATSLVTLPAIESNFLYFGKDTAQFKFADEEKGELVGAIMIPNKLIYRKIEDQAFYVNFTPEIIKTMTGKMIADGTAGLFSVQHGGVIEKDAVSVQEVWIKETENDKSIDFGIEEEIGTAFMKVKVNDEKIRAAIKDNGLNGFSIELDASIVEKSELFNKVEEPKKEINMKITDVFKNTINVNGVDLYFNADLDVKTYLVSDVDGAPVPYTGDFTHKGKAYVASNGVIDSVEDIEISTKEAIQALSDKFAEVEEAAKASILTQAAIDEKEAELELLKEQFIAEKAEFEKKKQEKREIKTNMAAQIAASSSAGNAWFKQFSDKK